MSAAATAAIRNTFRPLQRSSTLLSCTSASLRQQVAPLASARILGRWQHNAAADYDAKYAEKLRQVAEQRGTSVDQLRVQLREEEKQRRQERLEAEAREVLPTPPADGSKSSSSALKSASKPKTGERKDNSPVKPLSSILNLERLLETPHTAQQISALWTAYHSSRSGGTGRGYLCATVPLEAYNALVEAGKQYPSFVLPIARPETPGDAAVETSAGGENQQAYEFFFLQWGFHGAPPAPTTTTELFAKPSGGEGSPNPQTGTVLMTPLGEYKLRQSFATPHLVLTFHTDLAASHGIVLLRGELTPSTTGDVSDEKARYFLSQQDAQLLAMGVQQFYLWSESEGAKARHELLRAFHEKPEEFKWEDLLKHAQIV